ncbi:DUF4127 family protein [Deinococcus aquiradiocola]|uniref:DUF4127 family protein n=1 Tax=Deinococcus aquiradiocola TaxID=393059 RepID=A0A917P4Q4_9DEIO|nr:DUF4127 family protein [Deinococcus aquiradiocola]GGJ61655.1 hypothetical protein GCM10008939_01750 [Deinococcus aquiradiocola]
MRFRLPALLLTSLLATASLASAQSAAPTTPAGQATVGGETLIPLDSRPATSTLPAQMAGLLGGTVHVVPAALLGNATRGADPAALTAWLAAQPKDGPLIVSLDALAYGGLVQSRSSRDTVDTVMARLQAVRDWQRASGQPVYAFIVLPREPDAVDRARNLEVARRMIAWAGEGVFRELHVTWDDALPGSPSPAEGAELARTAPANVSVYPGADEVLGTLVARALAPRPATLAVEYSDPARADTVIRYEGIALSRSVTLHAAAAGWQAVTTTPEAIRTPFGGQGTRPATPGDLTLYVFNGGNARAAALRVSQLLRERGAVAVADVEQVNSGNVRAWADLYTLRRPQDLASLAAWGTPGNNLGTVLAHAKLALAGAPADAQDALLAREYANDIVYGSHLRAQLRALIPDARLPGSDASTVLNTLARPYFPLQFRARYDLQDVTLPWNRSFEADLKVTPAPPAP